MILVLSGEGKTDLGELVYGSDEFKAGAMYMIVDKIIENRYSYSPYETSEENIKYIPEVELSKKAKTLKPMKLPSKDEKKETAYYYKNARALAIFAKEYEYSIAILFRDCDGTNSSDKNHCKDKYNAMSYGFEVEEFSKGVAMLPNPKSESWILCALKNSYQNCNKLEDESGNDKSPKNLKDQLDVFDLSHQDICDKIKYNEIDIEKINMNSFNVFKERLEEVLG
jgi:hypothetical protein